MYEVSKELERLIVRRLDWVATPEEELELDRELLRNPDARRMLDDYRKIDELAVTALNHAIREFEPQPFVAVHSSRAPTIGRSGRRTLRTGWLLAGSAIAAMLAITVARIGSPTPPPAPVVDRGQNDATLQWPRPALSDSFPGDGRMNNVGLSVPRIHRTTGRDFFGVIGDDGNVYWLEVDRTTTVRQAPTRRVGPL